MRWESLTNLHPLLFSVLYPFTVPRRIRMHLMLQHSSSPWGISWGSSPAHLQWGLRMLLSRHWYPLSCVESRGLFRAVNFPGMFPRTDKFQARKWLDSLVQAQYGTTGAILIPSHPSKHRSVPVEGGPRLFSCPRPVLALLILSDPRIATVLKKFPPRNIGDQRVSGLDILRSRGRTEDLRSRIKHDWLGVIN